MAIGYLHSHRHLYPEGIGARQQQVGNQVKYGGSHTELPFVTEPVIHFLACHLWFTHFLLTEVFPCSFPSFCG
jgi:hypothetical protein